MFLCLTNKVSLSFAAGWLVDVCEDVVFDEAGEAQEDGVEHQTHQAEATVQGPLVQMDSQHLQTRTREDRRKMMLFEATVKLCFSATVKYD